MFRDNDWTSEAQRIPSMVIVRQKQLVMEHRVRTCDFETWLNAAPESPAEMVLKNRLQELFNR